MLHPLGGVARCGGRQSSPSDRCGRGASGWCASWHETPAGVWRSNALRLPVPPAPARTPVCRTCAALSGNVVGFTTIGGGTRVVCASRAPGIASHAVAAVWRPVPTVPEVRRFAGPARPSTPAGVRTHVLGHVTRTRLASPDRRWRPARRTGCHGPSRAPGIAPLAVATVGRPCQRCRPRAGLPARG